MTVTGMLAKAQKCFLPANECHVPKLVTTFTENEIVSALIMPWQSAPYSPVLLFFPLNGWWTQSPVWFLSSAEIITIEGVVGNQWVQSLHCCYCRDLPEKQLGLPTFPSRCSALLSLQWGVKTGPAIAPALFPGIRKYVHFDHPKDTAHLIVPEAIHPIWFRTNQVGQLTL